MENTIIKREEKIDTVFENVKLINKKIIKKKYKIMI